MDTRYHFFLTIVMMSLMLGSALHSVSIDGMSDFSQITDIDIAEDSVVMKTKCFNLRINGSQARLDDLEKAVYQDELPYSLELFEANLKKNSDLKRIEITGDSDSRVTTLVLENDKTIELKPMTALILAAESGSPIFVDNEFIRSEGDPTCLGQNVEV